MIIFMTVGPVFGLILGLALGVGAAWAVWNAGKRLLKHWLGKVGQWDEE